MREAISAGCATFARHSSVYAILSGWRLSLQHFCSFGLSFGEMEKGKKDKGNKVRHLRVSLEQKQHKKK